MENFRATAIEVLMGELPSRNEQDVREDILAPLLNELGYRVGTDGDIHRELVLRYDRSSLGKKKPKKDPYLKGRADYVLEVRGHARWVLEAKAPDEEIDEDSIDQAKTYALHPEVAAVYFAISNGHKFVLFKTSVPSPQDRLLELAYPGFLGPESPLLGVLSVAALKRDYSVPEGFGVPLGPGLRSLAKVRRGTIDYTYCSAPARGLLSLTISVVDGSVERGAEGQVIAAIRVRSPVREIQELIASLELDQVVYVSSASTLSTDPAHPTLFRHEGFVEFPAGRVMLDVNTWDSFVLPEAVGCSLVSEVAIYLDGTVVKGTIFNTGNYQGLIDSTINFSGKLEIELM